MRKRPWLVWLIIVVIFILGGVLLWMKLFVDKQPTTHDDPGIPQVEGLPDPDSVE